MALLVLAPLVCAAVSFVPNPIANSLAITGVQLKMLSDLSMLYGVPFSQDLVRSLLTATAGGVINFIPARNLVTRGVRDFLMATVPLIALPCAFSPVPHLSPVTPLFSATPSSATTSAGDPN